MRHGETGFVVAPESPEQLQAAMNALLADDALAARWALRRRTVRASISGLL